MRLRNETTPYREVVPPSREKAVHMDAVDPAEGMDDASAVGRREDADALADMAELPERQWPNSK
jgi:hypothetical protein